MKFDYIVQNPPYKRNLHIDIENYVLENALSETGKMTIIQPASWLIDVRKPDGKNKNAPVFDSIKSRLGNHVYKVVIENLNKEFDTGLYVPFSITYIDFSTEYNTIDFYCFGEHRIVKSIYDCNLVGDYDMIWSILNKVIAYDDTMNDHIYKPGKTKVDENTWFTKYADIISTVGCGKMLGGNSKNMKSVNPEVWYNNDVYYINGYLSGYFASLYHNIANTIQQSPVHACKSGGRNGSHELSDKIASNVYGTKEELENWKYFVYNNKLAFFVCAVLVISQNNRVKDIMPWFTDRTYTDNELYEILGINDEEQQFIDYTIKKYERHSPWFKRYMCGKDSVSDQEVQEFIDSLKDKYKKR